MTYQFQRAVDSLEAAHDLKFDRWGNMILLPPDFHNAANVPVALLSVANELYDVYALFATGPLGRAVVVAVSVSKTSLLDYAHFYTDDEGNARYRGDFLPHNITSLLNKTSGDIYQINPANLKSNPYFTGICYFEKRNLPLYLTLGFSSNIQQVVAGECKGLVKDHGGSVILNKTLISSRKFLVA